MAASKTLTFVESPLSSRLRFKLRTLSNFLLVVTIFIPVALASSQTVYSGIVDTVAIAVLFYLYFFFWDKRAIGMRCPHCRKLIKSNTPWVCGVKQCRNENIDDFPFVNRCEHCGAEPKAYRCHHRSCGKLIFLTEDELEHNYAFCINAPTEIKGDEIVVEISNQEREKRTKLHELTIADLDERLDAYKKRREFGKKKNPREAVREDFEKEYADVMAAEETALEQKAANGEKYKDNPEMLKRADLFVDDWLRRRL